MIKRHQILKIFFTRFFILVSLFFGMNKEIYAETITVNPSDFYNYFQLNGGATYNSGNNIVTLTTDDFYKSGAVVLKGNRIDLNYNFSFDFDINIGDKSQQQGGADGIGLVFHPGSLGTLGGDGGSFGMMTMKNAFGFKIDTFFNSQYEPLYVNAYDPAWLANASGQLDYPFGAFMYTSSTGLQVYTLGTGNNYEKPKYVSNPNGTFRNIKIEYTASNGYLSVTYDGQRWIKDINLWRGENRYFVFGISGTTGGQKNLQQVKLNKMSYSAEPRLELSKKSSTNSALVGDTIKYTVTLTNNGNAYAEKPMIVDILPEGMEKPTNVYLKGGLDLALSEGKENANKWGEYYTWDSATRKLTVYIYQTENLPPQGEQRILTYDSKISSGYNSEKKINTAVGSASNSQEKPTAEVTVTIKAPVLNVQKSSDPTTVNVGDTVDYTIVGKNTGNVTLYNTLFEDTLPEGMSEPTNIQLVGGNSDTYTISEGSENKNEYGEYYEWNATTRKLIVYVSRVSSTDGIFAGESRSVLYSSKVLSGEDREKKNNTVTFSGSNTTDKPSANATITIEAQKKIILHVKQEVLNKNSQVVIPTIGSMNLSNVYLDDINKVNETYRMEIPSYEVDTNQEFKTVILIWNEKCQGYLPEVYIPEFYTYVGYHLTTESKKHTSNNRLNQVLPILNYSKNSEYWLTVYIEPNVSEDGSPFYNWDYKKNDFGRITVG